MVTVSDVAVKTSTGSGVILAVTLSVDNPNRFGANLPDIEYQIYHNDNGAQTLLASSTIHDVRLGANRVTDIELEWKIDSAGVLDSSGVIKSIIVDGSQDVTIKGIVKAEFLSIEMDIPFSVDTHIG